MRSVSVVTATAAAVGSADARTVAHNVALIDADFVRQTGTVAVFAFSRARTTRVAAYRNGRTVAKLQVTVIEPVRLRWRWRRRLASQHQRPTVDERRTGCSARSGRRR